MSTEIRNIVQTAQRIKITEITNIEQIEQLDKSIERLEREKQSLQHELSVLRAQLAAAENDTDEYGDPDYSRINKIEMEISYTEVELSSVENELQMDKRELEQRKQEDAEIKEEKARLLFEIQNKAKVNSQDMDKGALFTNEYASYGNRLMTMFQGLQDMLVQAAGILGGTVATNSPGKTGAEKDGKASFGGNNKYNNIDQTSSYENTKHSESTHSGQKSLLINNVGISSSIKNKAKSFFNNYFGSSNENSAGNATAAASLTDNSFPANQILAGKEFNTNEALSLRLSKFIDKPVGNLNQFECDEIVDIVCENILSGHADNVDKGIFKDIHNHVFFKTASFFEVNYNKKIASKIGGCCCGNDVFINYECATNVSNLVAYLNHEILHLATNKIQGVQHVSGLNRSINEGMTEYLSIRDNKKINPDYKSLAYVAEVEIISKLDAVFDNELIENIYFTGDDSYLKSIFEKAIGKKEYDKFNESMQRIFDFENNYSTIEKLVYDDVNIYKKRIDKQIGSLEKYVKSHNIKLSASQSMNIAKTVNPLIFEKSLKTEHSSNNDLASGQKKGGFRDRYKTDISLESQYFDAVGRAKKNNTSSNTSPEDENKGQKVRDKSWEIDFMIVSEDNKQRDTSKKEKMKNFKNKYSVDISLNNQALFAEKVVKGIKNGGNNEDDEASKGERIKSKDD